MTSACLRGHSRALGQATAVTTATARLGRGCLSGKLASLVRIGRVQVLRGSCLCGGVRFEMMPPFQAFGECDCGSCRKISGGAGTINGLVSPDAITIVAGQDLLRTYQPMEGTQKTFCSVCGSNLFGAGWPDRPRASVRLSALDDPVLQ
jgi:hypothetical protein